MLLLGGIEALAEVVEVLLVLGLILRDRSVLPDAFFHHPGEQFHLRVEPRLLRLQVGQVKDRLDRSLADSDGFRPPGQQGVGGGEESGLDRDFIEVRRGAALLVFVLLIALPSVHFRKCCGSPPVQKKRGA